MSRRPCSTCPWRKSTPRGGFPGGLVMADDLLAMVAGRALKVMQCHCTPDSAPQACVGFALQVGLDSVGLRLAAAHGAVDLDDMECDSELHDLWSLLQTHGGRPA